MVIYLGCCGLIYIFFISGKIRPVWNEQGEGIQLILDFNQFNKGYNNIQKRL